MRTRIAVAAALLAVSGALARPAGALGLLPAQVTTTTPPETTPLTTVAPTTSPPSTAAPSTPATTSPPQTRTLPTRPTTTTSSSTTSTTTATTTTTTSSSSGPSGKTIALIVLAVIAGLLIILLIVLLVRRRRREQWERDARTAATDVSGLVAGTGQGLASLDQPALAARTWSDVESRGAGVHERLRTLAETAPDERAGAVVNGLDHDVQALRSAVDADRSLRLGPPAPTAEQLGYSAAVVRQRLADLQQSLAQLEDHLRQLH